MSLVAYKTAADIISKVVTLTVTVAAARSLSASDFGVLALAMTTGWLIGVASDGGLPMYAATRTAQTHRLGVGSYPIARAVMRWRLHLGLVAILAAAAVAPWLVPAGTVIAFLLIVLHQVLGAMLDTLAHVYRGLNRTDVESTLSIAHRSAVAVAALTVLAVQPTLLGLALALAAPPLLALIVSFVVVRRVARDGPAFPLPARTLATQVLPLGAGVLLSALYFRIDVYFLEYFHGVETVGAYNAAFRIVDALRLFPAALLAVSYPVLCSSGTLGYLARLSGLLATVAFVIAAALYLAAASLITALYGERFAPGAPVLQILALSVPLFFVNYALTHQVIAWGRQRGYLGVALAALLINVVGNLTLTPRWQMAGAAWSTLLTELAVSAGCLLVLRRR
jgi:O-antigen/teichoic acid export membrane protein